MSQKKKVRIYKAGGQEGQYINPTAKWMMQMGGSSQTTDDQIMIAVQQSILQGEDPNVVYDQLVGQGIPEAKVSQMLDVVMTSIEGLDDEAYVEESNDQEAAIKLAQKEAKALEAQSQNQFNEFMQGAPSMDEMLMDDEDYDDDSDFEAELYDLEKGGIPKRDVFIKQVKKQYGGKVGQSQKPESFAKDHTFNFLEKVKTANQQALLEKQLEEQAGQYYDDVMLPEAQRGREIRRAERQQRRYNRALRKLQRNSPMGMMPQGMIPQNMGMINPFGAVDFPGLKTANIEVHRTGLFGRPKEYSMTFDYNTADPIKEAEDVFKSTTQSIVDEESKKEQEGKPSNKEVAKTLEKTAETVSKVRQAKTAEEKQAYEDFLKKKREEGVTIEEMVKKGWGTKDGLERLFGDNGRVKKEVLDDSEESNTSYKERNTKWDERLDWVEGPEPDPNTSSIDFSTSPYSAEPIMGYPGAGLGATIADVYSYFTGEEVDRQAWDQAAASFVLPAGIGNFRKTPGLNQGFTTGKAVYTPPPGPKSLPPGNSGFVKPFGTPVPKITTTGTPRSLPQGPTGYLPQGPTGYLNQGPAGYLNAGRSSNQMTAAQRSAIRHGHSKNTAFSNYGRKTGFNAKPPTQYGPFKPGYGPSLQQGGFVNPFNTNPLAEFLYGGSLPKAQKGYAGKEDYIEKMQEFNLASGTYKSYEDLAKEYEKYNQNYQQNQRQYYSQQYPGYRGNTQYSYGTGYGNMPTMFNPYGRRPIISNRQRWMQQTGPAVDAQGNPVTNPGQLPLTKYEVKRRLFSPSTYTAEFGNYNQDKPTAPAKLIDVDDKTELDYNYTDSYGLGERLKNKGRGIAGSVRSMFGSKKRTGGEEENENVQLYETNPFEVEDNSLLYAGTRNNYGEVVIPDYSQTPAMQTSTGFENYYSPEESINRQAELMGTGQGTADIVENPNKGDETAGYKTEGEIGQQFDVDWGALYDQGMYATRSFLNNREEAEQKRQHYASMMTMNPNVDTMRRDRGNYDPNSGMFRPDQMGSLRNSQVGGQYNIGDEVEMTDEEIAKFIAGGGKLKYV
jgi:hypothetical protein